MNLAKAFKNWGKELYAYVFLRINNRQAAEDIVQEVFMKAWRSRETFDPKVSSLKTWLFVIARNALNDAYKEKANSVAEDLNENLEVTAESFLELDDKILVEKVFESLQELAVKERELIILRYKLDYKLKDIAQIMGISLSDAKVSLHRGMKKLIEICNRNL